MKISSFWFWQIPEDLKGTLVVLDIYMMTTNLSLMLSKKPKKLLIVNEENYQKAQEIYKNTLLLGESPKYPLSKFYATFPGEVAKKDFKKKTLLYMTLNGSRVFEKLYREEKGKEKILIGASFNNLKAVVDFLKDKKEINIIKSGDVGTGVLGDEIAAEILTAELQGEEYDWKKKKSQITDFFNYYYGHPRERDESIPYVFDKDSFNILPVCRKNREGYLEIFDKIK